MNGTCAPRTLAPRPASHRSVERRPTASSTRLLAAEAARLELGHLWSRGAAGRALVAIGAASAAVGVSGLVAGTYALL